MNEEFESIEMDEEDSRIYRRFSPVVIAWATIGLVLFIGLGVYISVQYYQAWKEEKTLTVEKVESQMKVEETSYQDYVFNFSLAGINKPIESYVYNVEISEDKRSEIDPLHDDPYIGYEENHSLHAALWEVDDGLIHILYDSTTDEVLSVASWNQGYELALQANKIRGEKATLTAEALKDSNPTVKKENKEKIEELNDSLLDLFSQINSNLGHN